MSNKRFSPAFAADFQSFKRPKVEQTIESVIDLTTSPSVEENARDTSPLQSGQGSPSLLKTRQAELDSSSYSFEDDPEIDDYFKRQDLDLQFETNINRTSSPVEDLSQLRGRDVSPIPTGQANASLDKSRQVDLALIHPTPSHSTSDTALSATLLDPMQSGTKFQNVDKVPQHG